MTAQAQTFTSVLLLQHISQFHDSDQIMSSFILQNYFIAHFVALFRVFCRESHSCFTVEWQEIDKNDER